MQYYYNNKPVKFFGYIKRIGSPDMAKIKSDDNQHIWSVPTDQLTTCLQPPSYADETAKVPTDEYMEADKNFYSSCQMSPFFRPGGLALAFNELSALAKQTVRERRIAHEMEVSKAVNHLSSLPEPQLTESKPTVFFDNVEDMMKAADKEECGTPARMDFLKDLDLITQQVFNMLSEKNLKYGDSALNPSGIFAKCDPIELINVRIDDKLARIKNGAANEDEDPEWDLIGYLFLKRIAKMRQGRING